MEEWDKTGGKCLWLNHDRDEFRPETGDLMKSRLTAALTTLGLAVAGVATAAPASADVPCTVTNFSPRTVIVGLSPITRTFGASSSGCSQTGWSIENDDLLYFVYESNPQ